ncbi:MAG: hypothetical protein EZS28_007468 [Streblomastix strix]|uniref:Uncharacterized protein n=1 Tax=Streblomastix strix TaxID=222440 RepID=A0A5J4WPU5_9EUKA|nr:MAG: hypothetical protein EZS28_007468 [Streblomastix strix]
MVGDYKENFQLSQLIDYFSFQFFDRSPVSCLTFVVYFGGELGTTKRVYTVLSRVLNHTSQVVLQCLESILKRSEFTSINSIKWWSDGGPCFKSGEFALKLLSGIQISEIKSITFKLNYFEPQHGKLDVDSIFGIYANLLKHNLPSSGINSLHELMDFLLVEAPECLQQTIIEYDVDKLNERVQNLKVDNFKKYLNFEVVDNILYSRLTSDETEPASVSPFKSMKGKVKAQLKKSDVSIDKENMEKELVQYELEQLLNKQSISQFNSQQEI